ncbi:MAG TPA: alpha/beta hydrolase-fold protein [Lacunisphaera sp.]|nr:alpha/beta hydrolase-fold protein [Lacunisphaera sp.]
MVKPAFTLNSPETGTEYWIHIAKPKAPEPWTAVLVLDGDDMFKPAVTAYQKSGVTTPLLIIGVGYGGSFAKPVNKRARDYTPVHAHEEATSGGAAKFRKFLRKALWPELARRYPIRDDVRGIAGYSLGALLVLDALFQPEPFFTHHLAASPAIWWGEAAMLGQVAALHAREPGVPGKLFLSVGEKDSQSMTGDLARLETQLGSLAFPRLEVTVRRFPGKNHFNCLPIAFETGLAALFGRESDFTPRS